MDSRAPFGHAHSSPRRGAEILNQGEFPMDSEAVRAGPDGGHVKRNLNRKNGARSKAVAAGQKGRLPLSDRETEVLRLLAGGVNTPGIAKKLFISDKTVRTHIQNILRKLGMHSRLEAVVYAYKQRVF